MLAATSAKVTLLVLAGVVTVAWTVTAVLRRKRGRRLVPRVPRWAVAIANGLLVVVLLIGGTLVMVNNYVGYVPTFGALFGPTSTVSGVRALQHASDAQRSRIVHVTIPAPADGISKGDAYVYLPPGYEQPANSGMRYPVIYLIHGYPGRAQDWFTAGGIRSTMDLLIRKHYIGPMIVVSPSASTGYLNDDECLNAPHHIALENYLAFDVVHAIDSTFRTVPDRAHRAIGGMSSGGYCSLNIGLHHLHRFSVILASEPYGDPGLHPLQRLLGGSWPLWRANSPSFYIPLWRFSLPVAAFFDSGGYDKHTTTLALALAQQLAQRGQQTSYRLAAGQHHNWREARAALPYALLFAWQHFGTLPNGGSDRADAAQFARILHYAETLSPSRPVSSAVTSSPPPGATPSPASSG
jgi:enterochelin esterase-like enzyme